MSRYSDYDIAALDASVLPVSLQPKTGWQPRYVGDPRNPYAGSAQDRLDQARALAARVPCSRNLTLAGYLFAMSLPGVRNVDAFWFWFAHCFGRYPNATEVQGYLKWSDGGDYRLRPAGR